MALALALALALTLMFETHDAKDMAMMHRIRNNILHVNTTVECLKLN